MNKNLNGFTLPRLIFAVVVITIVAAIAAPSLASRSGGGNEAAAIATLKKVFAAQVALRSGQIVDGDRDGISEYGYFQELASAKDSKVDRNGNGVTDKVGSHRGVATLSAAFGELDSYGLVHRGGYVFRIALPGALHSWNWEIDDPDNYPRVIANYAESFWACYAWPESYGRTGNRAFFVNQSGQIIAASNAETRYSGSDNPPPGRAAVVAGTSNWSMKGEIAIDAMGVDQNLWRLVQ